jgi:hypothetical protein
VDAAKFTSGRRRVEGRLGEADMIRQKRECRDFIRKESGAIVDLEMRGLEPLTSYMRSKRSTS